MSKLKQLITELCPDGVEYKDLEECCIILDNKRKPVTKSVRQSGEYPYYGANGIQDYVADYIFDGIYVLVGEDGSVVTKNGTPVVTWAMGKIWVNNHAHIIEEIEEVLLRYLFHYIQTINVSNLIHGNIPKLTGKDFKALQIPIPPLPVQAEIVRILDNFTELTAELTAELAARKKQYEYYKESLLTFGKDVEWKALGEVVQYSKEKIDAPEVDENSYVGVDNLLQNKQVKIKSNYVPVEGRLTKYQRADILIGNIRPYLRKIWFANNDGGTNGDVLVIRNQDKNILPKYLYMLLSSEAFFNYNVQNSKGAKMPRGNKEMILKYKIQIPSLSEQQHVVNILDRFDTLCNDISSGLPAEIKARQKQYEYYRDKLLTFPKVELEV